MLRIVKGTKDHLKAFYDAHNGRLDVDYKTFFDCVKTWRVFLVIKHKPIAIVVEKNNYAHIASYNNEKVGIKNMRQIVDLLNIKNLTVENEFKKGHALCVRLGFAVKNIINNMTLYTKVN